MEIIEHGTRVQAINYAGVQVEGTVTERHWFFSDLYFYVVREDNPNNLYGWEVPEHRIYPERDKIWAI